MQGRTGDDNDEEGFARIKVRQLTNTEKKKKIAKSKKHRRGTCNQEREEIKDNQQRQQWENAKEKHKTLMNKKKIGTR